MGGYGEGRVDEECKRREKGREERGNGGGLCDTAHDNSA